MVVVLIVHFVLYCIPIMNNIVLSLAGDMAGNLRNSDVLLGLVECVENGATVVSMSFGGRGRSTIEDGFYRQLFLSGIVLVAAAGNSGSKGNAIDYPAGYDSVISVGAVGSQRGVGLFSNYNDQVSLTAPGVQVNSLWATSDSSYVSASGTSMAAPYVSGVAALLVSLFPWATASDIREAMEETALDTGACGYDPLCTSFYTGGNVSASPATLLFVSHLFLTPFVTCLVVLYANRWTWPARCSSCSSVFASP
jgi:serine protease